MSNSMIRRLVAISGTIVFFYIGLYENDTNLMLANIYLFLVVSYVSGDFESKDNKE